MTKAFLRFFASCAMLSATAGVLAEMPPEAQSCAACHGTEAPSSYPAVPTIHGLPASALENALYDFRAGLRSCRKLECGDSAACPEVDFCAIVAGLDDDDIDVLSQWYAAQPYAAVEQSWDPGLAEQGKVLHQTRCESCHSDGGTNALDQASILRGQPKPYLRAAIEDFRQERRISVAEMDASLRELTGDQVEALLEFYASPR